MQKLIFLLKELKFLGASGVKVSLEDEGATFEDLKTLRLITNKIKLPLNIKIGGCEAKNDINYCKKIRADSIVAPMVESSYALKKFLQVALPKSNYKLLFNLETISSVKNLNKFISTNEFKKLDGVVIGRSDIVGSLNLKKNQVDKKKIQNIVINSLKLIKNKNKKLLTKMGGSISFKSKDFINTLKKKKLLDRFETRNLEFYINTETINNFDLIMNKIFNFEMHWLKLRIKKNKLSIYSKNELKKRINEIQNRLQNA